MKSIYTTICIMACNFYFIQAQILADFETAETSPQISNGSATVVNNPDKNGNPSAKVGKYLKAAGNWQYVDINFAAPVGFKKMNTLSFKLNASIAGRIFAKFWLGNKVVIENWAPKWEFMPTPNKWVECTMDVTNAMGQSFDKLELAACVDNTAEAIVYFDDVKLYNPQAAEGTPVIDWKFSPALVIKDSVITFDASKSFDWNDLKLSYQWDFGDGSTGQDTSIETHTYTSSGTYKVSLVVSNTIGKSITKNSYIFVFDKTGSYSGLKLVTNVPKTNEKIEVIFQINKPYINKFDPEEISVDAVITKPSGRQITVPCFYFIDAQFKQNNWVTDSSFQCWKLRFSSDSAGDHKIKIKIKDGDGEFLSDEVSVLVSAGNHKGIIKVDEQNKQLYKYSTGERYIPTGINLAWNQTDSANLDRMGSFTHIMKNIADNHANLIRYWMVPFANQGLEWKKDGSFYKGLGIYSQGAAAQCDSLLAYCDLLNMQMQLTLFQHGMFSENVDSNWDANPYNSNNGGYINKAEDYFSNTQCKVSTKKLLRYIVARYGYATNLFAWEFFNEVQFTGNFGQQTANWLPNMIKWHSEMSHYVDSLDAFNHLTTTSASNDQLLKLDTVKKLDVLQYHIYDANIIPAIVETDSLLLQKVKKPLINGEFGYSSAAINADDLRKTAWLANFTTVPHYFWYWNYYLDPAYAASFKNAYEFANKLDLISDKYSSYLMPVVDVNSPLHTVAMRNSKEIIGMVYATDTITRAGQLVSLPGLLYGYYKLTYINPETNDSAIINNVAFVRKEARLELPAFSKGLVYRIKFIRNYENIIALSGHDTLVGPGESVQLTAKDSYTPFGKPLTYKWSIFKKPQMSSLTITSSSIVDINVLPDVPGEYVISLIVADADSTSIPYYIKIKVSAPPVASAGDDIVTDLKTRVTLDGSKSFDLDGDVITYQWVKLSSPGGSAAILKFPKKDKAEIVPDVDGHYVFTLTVNDGFSDSEQDTVVVKAGNYTVVQNKVIDGGLFSLYPNQVVSNLTIKLNSMYSNNLKIEIVDITGKTLYLKNILPQFNDEFVIGIDKLNIASGLYFVKLTSGKRSEVKKFIFKQS